VCGIAGFNRADTTSIPNGRKFAFALAEAIEDRGRHATGAAWAMKDNVEDVFYAKKQGPAAKVVRDLAMPRKGMSNIIVHTRQATLGSSKVYANLHPTVSEHVALVHNGRVDNHAELIAMTGLTRQGEVDSWALPAMISQQVELGATHPTELLELVRGVAAVAWIEGGDAQVLHLARLSTRPLHFGWTKRGDFVFASTISALLAASKAAGVGVNGIQAMKQGQYLRVESGSITESRTFKVNHPPVKVAEDMPRRVSQPYLTAFDADDVKWWAEYDAYEARSRSESEIDWDSLVPRRGHKGYVPEDHPF
jgi:glucosamine 6-phosphate synthetase-like amidotransferase/phosphosugar isomerase protein